MAEPIVGSIDFNDLRALAAFETAVQSIVARLDAYFPIRFKPGFYFEIPTGSVPARAGWYIILHSSTPIYVGKTDDLNTRLNTNHGSLDNFAKKERAGDPERNIMIDSQ